MGISFAALVAAALILPGILGLAIFFSSVNSAEVKLSPPPIGTTFSIAIAGGLAQLSHAVWALCLLVNSALPPLIPWPAADPYRLFFMPSGQNIMPVHFAMAMVGLIITNIIGCGLGRLLASGDIPRRNEFLFGWLYPIIKQAAPANAYINAYVISNIENGKDILGYDGTVDSIILDEAKEISALVLVNVTTFYLRLNPAATKRIPTGTQINHLILRKGDFKNVALIVVRYEA